MRTRHQCSAWIHNKLSFLLQTVVLFFYNTAMNCVEYFTAVTEIRDVIYDAGVATRPTISRINVCLASILFLADTFVLCADCNEQFSSYVGKLWLDLLNASCYKAF